MKHTQYSQTEPLTDKQRIVQALQKMRAANYELLAIKLGCEAHVVSRRLKEMVGQNLVEKTGRQIYTLSGKPAAEYRIKDRQLNIF